MLQGCRESHPLSCHLNALYHSYSVACFDHDDVIKFNHFLCYWPSVRWIHRSSVISRHKCQRRGGLIFSMICAWINGWVNNREASDLRRHYAHYDVTVIIWRRYSLASSFWETPPRWTKLFCQYYIYILYIYIHSAIIVFKLECGK